MKILITGANGLLGQKLVDACLAQHLDFVATGAGKNRRIRNTQFAYRVLDITDQQAVNTVIREENPTTVIHAAAMTNVDACELDHAACDAANVDAVRYIAEVCEALNIHLIHLSTDFIFDGADGPYAETATPNPLSYYGVSKLKAEQLVQAIKSPWSIVRTVLVYGVTEGDTRSNVVRWVHQNVAAHNTIHVVEDQYRTPTWAEDLAQGCLLIAAQRATGIYHISGADFMNIYTLALRVAKHYQLDSSYIKPSTSEGINQPAKRPPRTGFIIDKARNELGFAPTPFEETLHQMDVQRGQIA